MVLGLTTTDFFNLLFDVEEKDNPITESENIENVQNEYDI